MSSEIDRSFLISLDYGDREKERTFVHSVLTSFDRNTLVGALLLVNNNPYNLELLFLLNFEKDSEQFESWLEANYPEKKRVYNIFLDDFCEAIRNKGYNLIGLSGTDDLEFQMSSDKNDMYFFPDRKIMNGMFGKATPGEHRTVFLSHSSKDKPLVDKIFNELQKVEVKAWYDRYEIKLGDSITDKINDGLRKSDLGVIFYQEILCIQTLAGQWPKPIIFFRKK